MENKSKPIVMQAYDYLKKYAEEHSIEDICDVFDKETMVEYVSICDWDWSVHDEKERGKTEEEAIEATRKWLESMSKRELFYERIPEHNRHELILCKADELGFEPKEEAV